MAQQDSDDVTIDVTERCLNTLQRRLSFEKNVFEITGVHAREEVGSAVVVARMDGDARLTRQEAQEEVHVQIQGEEFMHNGSMYRACVDTIGDVHTPLGFYMPDSEIETTDEAYFAEITVSPCP